MENKKITSGIDFILSYGQENLQKLLEHVRYRLVEQLGDYYEFGDFSSLLAVTRDIIAETQPLLAKILSDAQIAAWATGVDNVLSGLPKKIPIVSLEPPERPDIVGPLIPALFEEPIVSDLEHPEWQPSLTKINLAVKDIDSRTVVTRQQFDQLSETIKRNSFTVAYQSSLDTIDKIREALSATIQNGVGKARFKKELAKVFDVSPMSPSHQDLVLRTNVMSALANGRDTIGALQEIRDAFPFSEVIATHDDRVRPEHLALESLGLLDIHGKMTGIYWNDDTDFWNLFASPWSFRCRCSRNYLGLQLAAEKGVAVAVEWLKTGIRPQMVSCLPNVPFRPDPNFVGGGRLLSV